METITISEANAAKWEAHKASTFHDPFCNFIKEAQPSL